MKGKGGNKVGKYTRISVLAFTTILLISCVSKEEQQAINSGQCERAGYKKGTKAFSDCMKDIDSLHGDMDEREDDRMQQDELFFSVFDKR